MTADKRNGQDETNSQASAPDEAWQGPARGLGFGHPAGPHHHPRGAPHLHRPPAHHDHHHHAARHGPRGPGLGHRDGLGADGFSERASDVLSRILSPDVVNWVLRAASFGPPEIVAIFKVQVAAIGQALAIAEVSGADPLWFTPEDLQTSEETYKAMTLVMTGEEARACLHNLFLGPEEVQAAGFLSLVVLRATLPTGADDADSTES